MIDQFISGFMGVMLHMPHIFGVVSALVIILLVFVALVSLLLWILD